MHFIRSTKSDAGRDKLGGDQSESIEKSCRKVQDVVISLATYIHVSNCA